MPSSFASFASAIAALELTQLEIAVALIWYHETQDLADNTTVSAVAGEIHDLALGAAVNQSRLEKNLALHKAVVRGRAARSFRIRATHRDKLDGSYLPFVTKPRSRVLDSILISTDFENTRPYVEGFVRQINGCYQHALYDGCAVLSRRLIETLLIEAFEAKGKTAEIQSGGNYVGLDLIIAKAASGQHVKLSRNTPKLLEQVKLVGDKAAHDRRYLTKKEDIDHLAIPLRQAADELLHLANLKS